MPTVDWGGDISADEVPDTQERLYVGEKSPKTMDGLRGPVGRTKVAASSISLSWPSPIILESESAMIIFFGWPYIFALF